MNYINKNWKNWKKENNLHSVNKNEKKKKRKNVKFLKSKRNGKVNVAYATCGIKRKEENKVKRMKRGW